MSGTIIANDFKRRAQSSQVEFLAELDGNILVLGPQGFLLLFQERSLDQIIFQLRDFDADEWRPGISSEKTFERELDGLAPATRFRDADDILAVCSTEALSRLNRDILNISGSNLEFYNLLHSTSPFRTKARIQALTVLPMLKWEFHIMTDVTDRIRRRIDDGKSVWDAFLEMHPGKASILRRMASAKSVPETWRGDTAGLLSLLDPLPPEKVPSSEVEWNAFHSVCIGLRLDRATERHRDDQDEKFQVKLRWLIELGRVGWQKSYERLASFDGGMGALSDAFDLLDEIRDAGDYLAKKAGEECTIEANWWEKSRKRWLKAPTKFGVFRIVDYSARWHRVICADTGVPESTDTSRSVWPSLFAQPIKLAENVYATCLGNAAALSAEGRRMQHCVGLYWKNCFLGNSHIVSLRNDRGQSLSTLEFRVAKDGTRQCEIIQHRAHQNKTPSDHLRALEGNLKALILQHTDFNSLAQWRKNAKIIDENFGDQRKVYDEERFNQLSAVIGRERLEELFTD